jgi:Tol biopolymer transport system component/tRNA A-37 threonylcarbamoyl transferase component Bud32
MLGKTLSHYEIVEQLGEGGMGVVYKARDTRLNRFVALKVLPHDKVADPERKRRFIQEAQAASALNHLNIVTIYDIGQADGVDFIAMEYVAGKTLDRLIPKNGMRLPEVLKYAIQIANALTRAHAAGIIHRDIKPGNIIVGPDGTVKVLDFGLAKLTERVEARDATATMHAPLTDEGAIIGTVAYMSPEQAEGIGIDTRSDIFSFGVVLYEMATGRRAFQGETKMSTLAAVLRQEPRPLREVASDVPRDLEKIVARCLRKDPNRRFQNMSDVVVALDELKEESESGKLEAAPAPPKRAFISRRLAVVALAILAVAAAGIWWLGRSRTPSEAGGPVLTRLVADPGLNTDPALSPDGKLLAYASDRGGNGSLDIWVRQLAGGEPLRLTDNPADDSEPVFSPDGSQIAFRSDRDGGGIYAVSVFGGEARRITRQGRHPRYSPAGDQIAYSVGVGMNSSAPAQIFVVPAAGGAPRQLQPGFFQADLPIWSPDGKHLLFDGRRAPEPQGRDWWVTPVEGGEAIRTNAFAPLTKAKISLEPTPVLAIWAGGPDRIVFSGSSGDTTNLWEIPISGSFQITDPPRRLTFGTGTEASPSMAQAGSRVAFADLNLNLHLWSLPLDANGGKVTGEPLRLTDDPAQETAPFVSADGRKIAFNRSVNAGKLDLWLKELPGGKETPLLVSPVSFQAILGATISPDGSRVAFPVSEGQVRAIYTVSTAGGDPERLCRDCFMNSGNGWSPDARSFIASSAEALILVDRASGQKTEIFKNQTPSGSIPNRVRFSPDGKWLSFHVVLVPESRRVYVTPFKGAVLHDEKEWIPITDGLGMERYADWSPDGNVLYFLSERDGFRCIRGQRLDPATKHPVGPPFDVIHFHNARRSLGTGDPVSISPTVARDKMVFSMIETTGSIWMATLDHR